MEYTSVKMCVLYADLSWVFPTFPYFSKLASEPWNNRISGLADGRISYRSASQENLRVNGFGKRANGGISVEYRIQTLDFRVSGAYIKTLKMSAWCFSILTLINVIFGLVFFGVCGGFKAYKRIFMCLTFTCFMLFYCSMFNVKKVKGWENETYEYLLHPFLLDISSPSPLI